MYSKGYPTRCNVTQFVYFCKLLYMFRAVPPPIIRSTKPYLQHLVLVKLQWRGLKITNSVYMRVLKHGVVDMMCCGWYDVLRLIWCFAVDMMFCGWYDVLPLVWCVAVDMMCSCQQSETHSYSTTNKMQLFLKLNVFILVKRSTYFGQSFRPSWGAQNCTYACCRMCSFELLIMKGKTVRNM